MIIVGDAGSVLVHADDRGIDHLHRRVTTGGQCIHDPVPDASPPPTNEAIVACPVSLIASGQVAPRQRPLTSPADGARRASDSPYREIKRCRGGGLLQCPNLSLV